MRADWPELSDLIIDVDPHTLARRPVRRADVVERLRSHGMRQAERVLRLLPDVDGVLDESAVDQTLLRAHTELQRLAFEFRNGERLLLLLRPLLEALRRADTPRPLRVVDIGCGLGFVLRWLAAHGRLGDDVELVGCDMNPALIAAAQALAAEERLACRFLVTNALTLKQPAHVFLSTGVLHHFRGPSLAEPLRAGLGSSGDRLEAFA